MNGSRVTARGLLFASFTSIAAGVSAQTQTQVLTPIVVTAARFEQTQTDVLPHTTVITSEDIRNSQAADLPTLLRREAGIQITQNGGPGQLMSMFMRGAQASEALILIDGVPVRRQGFSPAPALEHILPEQIDHIEIVRGNVSAIYGSSAIGGVVQIFTKQGSGRPAASLGIEAGSRGTRQASASMSGRLGDTRYALSLTSARTDGFSANNITQYPNENPDDNGSRNVTLSGNLSHEWGKGQQVGMRVYANEGNFTFDGGGFGTPTDRGLGRSQQQSVAVFSKNRMNSQWNSVITLSQTATRNENVSIAAFGYTIRDNGDTTLLQWSNDVALSSAWTLIGGIDAGREKLDAFADYGFGATRNIYTRSTASLFAGLNGTLGAHQLQANLRHDNVGGSGSDLTGFLGYGFNLMPAVKLIASASTAFNAPSLAQLYDPISGNSGLKSESSTSYEAGVQYAEGASIVRATLFMTKTKNQFAADPANCFSGAYPFSCPTFNVARAHNRGVELTAHGKVFGIDARAALTVQDPRNEVSNDVLIRRARTLATLGLSKTFGAWYIGGDAEYAGSRPDTDFTTSTKKNLGAYWLFNVKARYRFSQQLSVYGRIDNLFDREYQTTYGFNQAPRGIFIGANWTL